ncbi:MAG TPA: GGDEF domain-containing protein [bacterium]|nr:GGDEF domain-containing protein [bacterium]
MTAALIVYGLLFVLWLIARPGAAETRALIADGAFVPSGLAVAVLAWRTARQRGLSSATRGAWRAIAAAVTLWWLGDVTWLVYSAVLGEPPFPSAADAFYLPFYPLMMVGLLAVPGDPQNRVERTTFLLDALTVLLGGWMVVWYFVLGPIAVQEGSHPLVTILSAAYPVGDLVLIFGVAAVLLRASSPAERRPLALLGAGGAAFLVADLAFGALSLRDAYAAGDWPDAFWMIAALLFGAAAQAQSQEPAAARPEEPPAPSGVRAVSPLPYAAVGLGYLLLLAAGRATPIYPLGGLLTGAVAITALVLIRQVTLMNEHIRILAELHALARTDPLTELHTRRHFIELAEREYARTRRYGRPLAALMLDVDHFKQINDRFGHGAGDAVLRTVAAQLRASLRDIDLVARYGGDEFIALLPESTVENALDIAERLRARVAAAAGGVGPQRIAATVSVGVASADGTSNLEALLRRVDQALYQAKAAGRNTVRSWTADR